VDHMLHVSGGLQVGGTGQLGKGAGGHKRGTGEGAMHVSHVVSRGLRGAFDSGRRG
jgi:hypothetical protein